jgi:hypothetical protein
MYQLYQFPQEIQNNPLAYFASKPVEHNTRQGKHFLHTYELAGVVIGDASTFVNSETKLIIPSAFQPLEHLEAKKQGIGTLAYKSRLEDIQKVVGNNYQLVINHTMGTIPMLRKNGVFIPSSNNIIVPVQEVINKQQEYLEKNYNLEELLK